jgi:predicted HicB family RNase H-like nuclease
MTTFRSRKGHQAKNLEKAEDAFLKKAEEPTDVPDVVPQETTAPAPKVRKYGFAAFNLRLEEDQLDRLRRAALKHDRSMHYYAVKALMKAVDEDLG